MNDLSQLMRLLINQIAIRAAIEEVSLWINQRGSTSVHDNVMTTLQALDVNAGALARFALKKHSPQI